jgi:hypothetical protein
MHRELLSRILYKVTTFYRGVYGMIILKWFGGNKLWGCQLDFRDCFPRLRGDSSLLSVVDGTRATYLADIRGFPWTLRKYIGNTVPSNRHRPSFPFSFGGAIVHLVVGSLVEVKTLCISEERTYKLKLKKLRLISSRRISEKVKGKQFLEDLDIGGRMILKRILNSGKCVFWIHLLQDGV